MIDFHSHILPGMDDGPKTVEDSLRLIGKLEEQGTEKIVSASHFYCRYESPHEFVNRRTKSFERLKESLGDKSENIILGAEVYYFDGMEICDELSLLTIQNTNTILLEMPFKNWNQRTVDSVISLKYSKKLNVVLAHIERYFGCMPKGCLSYLRNEGIFLQSNSTFFANRFSRSKALKYLSEDKINILGSDAHNLTDRAPKLKDAENIIVDKLGNEAMMRIDGISKKLLNLE